VRCLLPTPDRWGAARPAKVMYFNQLTLFVGAAVRFRRWRMPYPDPETTDISYAT
jgi:hypothetical protein